MPLYYKAGCNPEKGDASDAGQWEEYETFTFIKANVHTLQFRDHGAAVQCIVRARRICLN